MSSKDLGIAARKFAHALDELKKAADAYAHAAVAVGTESGDPTGRGLNWRQVRRRIEAELVARLSPRPVLGMPEPVFQLHGAPEARRYIAANPLPGLS